MLQVAEMINIMETLESLETRSSQNHGLIFDESGNVERIPTAEERARDLFEALDKDGDGFLTKEEFVKGDTFIRKGNKSVFL